MSLTRVISSQEGRANHLWIAADGEFNTNQVRPSIVHRVETDLFLVCSSVVEMAPTTFQEKYPSRDCHLQGRECAPASCCGKGWSENIKMIYENI